MIMKPRLIAGAAAAALLGVCAPMLAVPGHSDTADHQFAVSKSKEAAVLIAGGTDWCQDRLAIRAVLSEGSPLIDDRDLQAAFVNQLGPLLADSCPKAQTATLTIVQPDGPRDSYAALASRNWV